MDNVTKFLVYCIEIFKASKKINGKQALEIFNQYGILEYIVKYHGALHTTGPEYIVEDISEYIEEQRMKQ